MILGAASAFAGMADRSSAFHTTHSLAQDRVIWGLCLLPYIPSSSDGASFTSKVLISSLPTRLQTFS